MMHKTILSLGCAAWLGFAGAAAAAGGLGVEMSHGASAAAGAFTFEIHNDASETLRDVAWYGTSGHVVGCAAQTRSGHGFVAGGNLAAGDSVACAAAPQTLPARVRNSVVVVSARDTAGVADIRHASFSVRGAPVTPDQGIVVVIAGAVHVDPDLDGILDTGETIDYHYTLVNAGTLGLAALAVEDLAGNVAGCSATLAPGASTTCTRSYTIAAGDQANGFVLNEVEVAGTAANGDAVQAVDLPLTLNNGGTAAIRVFKSPLLLDDADASGYASEGDVLGYTFVVKNANAQTLTSVDLIEPDPTLIDGPIACAATTLGGQAFSGLGSGVLLSNDVLLCTAEHTITPAEAATGEALNLVEASGIAAIGGTVWGSGASAVGIPAGPLLAVAKTANVSSTVLGGSVIYTITVTNLGSTEVLGVTINDPVPTGIMQFSWTCAGSGVACPNASGSGAIAETVPLFPVGAQLVYTVTAAVAFDAPSAIQNVVTVTPQTNVLCAPDGTPSPCAAIVPLLVGEPFGVPLGGRWPMLLLAGLLGVGAATRLRAQRR